MSRSPYDAFALSLTLALGACTIITDPADTASGTTSATTGTTAADTTADMTSGTTAGTTAGMTLDTDPVVPTTSGGTTDALETSSTTSTTNPMPCTDVDADVALDDDSWPRSPQSMLDAANSPMNGTLSDVNAVETALTLSFTAPTGMGHISGTDCPEDGFSYELWLPIEVSFVTADGAFNEVLKGQLLEDGGNDMTYQLDTLDVLDVIGSFKSATLLEPMGFAQGDFDSLYLEFAMDTFAGDVNLSGTLNRVACMGEADCYRTFVVGDIVRER